MRINIKSQKPKAGDIPEQSEELPPATPQQQIQMARIMGYIGAALIAVFLMMIAYTIYENSKTVAVKGTVVSVDSRTDTSGSGAKRTSYTTYSHVFRYTDPDGVEHIADTGDVWRQIRYPVGDVVSIGYYPDNPELVRIHSWFGYWKLQIALLFFGGLLIWYARTAVRQLEQKIAEQG